MNSDRGQNSKNFGTDKDRPYQCEVYQKLNM